MLHNLGLKTSDIIQIAAIIVSTITSIVSIYIALKSLKQANQSIIDANKPYIVVYSDFIQVDSVRMNYLIIKNYGKSSAIIDSIKFSNDDFYTNPKRPFYNLSNCSIAPNQFYSCRVLYEKDPYVLFNVTIKYHDNINTYNDTFTINTEALAKQLVSLTTNNEQDPLEKTISTVAQEIIRRNF
ncbi:MAG: hypothetical protein E7C05_17215 [Clostridium botulinum]|uniref:hypothetical protein n=1 Tax=Clostridium sporogenes TaxID=1509 RepID=UPI001C6092A9|nr:hypothetical protein [Clostridium sporogenes]MBW5458503.1 hypothetical protein [Clostridium sporogenes]MDU2834285.1 hypothetical protein [Clostridium botulinum]